MKGIQYKNTNQNVQLSFAHKSHQNLPITSVASTSTPITNSTEVFLSLIVSAHVRVGSDEATISDFVLPSGVWPLLIKKGQTISVLQLSGSLSGQASIIIPED